MGLAGSLPRIKGAGPQLIDRDQKEEEEEEEEPEEGKLDEPTAADNKCSERIKQGYTKTERGRGDYRGNPEAFNVESRAPSGCTGKVSTMCVCIPVVYKRECMGCAVHAGSREEEESGVGGILLAGFRKESD